MASTYTVNLGLQQPASGEQSGSWGGTVNTNYDQIDMAIGGSAVVQLTAAGTTGAPNQVKVINSGDYAELSTGKNAFISFTDNGSLASADAYVQFTPNTSKRIIVIANNMSTGDALVVFQGSWGSNTPYTILNGCTAVLMFDGGGTSAAVTNVNSLLQVGTKVVFPNNAGTAESSVGTDALDDFNVLISGVVEAHFDSSENVWDFKTNSVKAEGTVILKERTASLADVAAYGQVWIKNDTPNTLWFTDDTGTDHQLGVGGNLLTTKGDLYGFSTVAARIPVGTDAYVLTADSTQALGVKWAAAPSGFSDPMTTRGDIIYRNSVNTTARLGLGTNGQVLQSNGSDLVWATNPASGTFLGLSDTPGSYIGSRWVRVNSGATALEFVTSPVTSVSGSGAISSSGGTSPQISISNASETVRGAIEIATQTEVNDGVDNLRAVTPYSLQLWTGVNTITTVGTISTGTWNAGVIGSTKGGTGGDGTITGSGSNVLAISPTFTGTVQVANLTASGTLQAVTFNRVSARDQKNEIGGYIDPDRLLLARSIRYVYKKDPERKQQMGFYADDMANLYPEVVQFDADGNPTGIDYAVLVVPLTEKAKQQDQVIKALLNRVDALEQRLSALEAGK